MTTTLHNIRHLSKKQKLDPDFIYIGRAGKGQDGYFGNPIKLEIDTLKDRVECLLSYCEYFFNRLKNDEEFKERILTLENKHLYCFCEPVTQLCHGKAIIYFLENKEKSLSDIKQKYLNYLNSIKVV